MRFPRDTYLKFNVFCKTVVLEAKSKFDMANLGTSWGTILLIIAAILGVGIPAFVTVNILLASGMLTYYGSIGALIAANPVLAGVLLALSTAGLAGILQLLWKKRRVLDVVKETVVDRYRGDFEFFVQSLPSDNSIPGEHAANIERLVERAVIDLLNALVRIGEVSQEDFETVYQFLRKGAL